jgi:plasmid maintenance system antidote protein VapI
MSGSAEVPQLLTMDQLAERLGVTRRHVRRLIAERQGCG